MCRKHASDSTSSVSTESAVSPAEDISGAFCESSYADYLLQARTILEQCAHACRNWSALYDGEHPPPDSVLEHPTSVPVANSNPGDAASSASVKGSSGDSRENDDSVSSDAPEERKRSRSTVKLLSHGNMSESGNTHLPDSETLAQQANSSGGDQRPCGANSSGGDTASDGAALSQNSSKSSSVIAEMQCNKVPSSSSATPPSCLVSSSLSHPPSQRITHDLTKLCMCLDLDSFLARLNELDLPAEVSSESLEESFTALDRLLSALSMKRKMVPESSTKKLLDSTQNASLDGAQGKTEKQSETQASSAPSADRSISGDASSTVTTNPALFPQVRKTPAPPKTLGLAPSPSMEISFGGKCRVLSPLRTPDDMSRAFIMSPSSTGFLLSPSSSSSSAAQRPLPAALRYSSSPPNIGKRRFYFSSSHQRLCCSFCCRRFQLLRLPCGAFFFFFAMCSFSPCVCIVLLCLCAFTLAGRVWFVSLGVNVPTVKPF